MRDKLNQTLSMLNLWMTNLINFEPVSDELNRFWAYECRTLVILRLWIWTWSTLSLWMTNLNNFGPMNNELDKFWAYEWRTWSIFSLSVTSLINFDPMTAELDQFLTYEWRTWLILNKQWCHGRELYTSRSICNRPQRLCYQRAIELHREARLPCGRLYDVLCLGWAIES